MKDLTDLWDLLMSQRGWSWTLAGIVYLAVFLAARGLVFHTLLKRARALNSKWYHEIKKVYGRKCIGGWILFLVSFLILVLLWQSANLQQPSFYEVAMLCILVLSLLLSIMAHMIAFAISTLVVLKQLENNQMTL